MRLFLAVEVNKRWRDKITALAVRGLNAAYVRPVDYHVTVVFIGGVGGGEVPAVKDALANAISRFTPFRLKAKRLGWLDEGKRSVWAIIFHSEPAFLRLKKTLIQLLSGFVRQDEARRTRPHLTLFRLKRRGDLKIHFHPRGRPESRRALAETVAAVELPVKRVSLIKSRLTPSGPVYKTLTRFPLGR